MNDTHAPTPGARILLVRHGETAENRAGRFLGRSDPSLTEDGRVAATASRAAAARFRPDRVVTSPARRARETADALGLPGAVLEPDLREVDFGRWEGLTPAEAAVRDPELHAAFTAGVIAGFPEGESIDAAAARILAALERHSGGRTLVVTHATVIRIAVTALLGLPLDHYRALLGRPDHCSLTEVQLAAGTWRLLSYSAALSPTPSP